MVTPALQSYIENTILPRYDAFDAAHTRSHVCRVIEDSLHLATFYPQLRIDIVYTAAAYHDLGIVAGREVHHLESGKILMADETLECWFSPNERTTIKEAVEDHRASNPNKPRDLYGLILAEADRVIDTQITLTRTLQYGLSHYPQLSCEEQFIRFEQHLHEKYAEGGYLKLWIPQSPNAARLQALRAIISNPTALRQWFLPAWNIYHKDLKLGIKFA